MTVIPFPETQKGCCGRRAPEWFTLPVAPQAAARVRFCGEDKLPRAVPLQGALNWIADVQACGNSIAGLNLSGPGDPLATLRMTCEILTLLKEKYPELPLGLTTLGLGLAEHAIRLAEHGVTRVTVLVDAVDPYTVQKLYAWIRPGKRNTPLAKAAEILIDEQAKAITACKAAGIQVSVQTTVYAGVNEREVGETARRLAGLGAESMTLLPGKGLAGREEKLRQPSGETMEDLAKKAGQYFKVVRLLRVPAPGGDIIPLSRAGTPVMPKPTKNRPNVAVLSTNGMDIDLHLGQAIKALIYGPREDGLACLLEVRNLPAPGTGDRRWEKVAGILDDCFVLLAASAGQKPLDILGRHGLTLLLMEDNVEGTVDVLYGGSKNGKGKK